MPKITTQNRCRITQNRIDKLTARDDDTWLWDTEVIGFGVRATPAGRKTYVARYSTLAGVSRRHRIARCCDMTPEAAREFARGLFAKVAAGGDPLTERKPAPTENTVEALFDAYASSMEAEGASSASEVRRALLKAKNNAADALGRTRAASDVTPGEVVEYIASLYSAGHPGAADKHRSYIGSAYNWGMKSANDYRVKQRRSWGISRNPVSEIVRDRDATNVRDRNLSIFELRRLWRGTRRGSSGFSLETAACIRIIIACGQRVQETLRMDGREINMKDRVWHMPAAKTKMRKRDHDIPLPDVILDDVQFLIDIYGDGPLFPGRLGAERMDHRTINRALGRWAKRSNMLHFQTRDIRRTWKSRAHDAGLSKETRDLIQQHSKNDTSSKVYDRAEYMPQKRAGMSAWSDWIQRNLEEHQIAAAAA